MWNPVLCFSTRDDFCKLINWYRDLGIPKINRENETNNYFLMAGLPFGFKNSKGTYWFCLARCENFI